MSIDIAKTKIALGYAKKMAAFYQAKVKTCTRPSEQEYCWARWSYYMQLCRRFKRLIAEVEGHYKAKERAFNGKFYPKSK